MAKAWMIRQVFLSLLVFGFFILVYKAVGHPASGFVVLLLILKRYMADPQDVYVGSLYARYTASRLALKSPEADEAYKEINRAVGYNEKLVSTEEVQYGSQATGADAIIWFIELAVLIFLMIDFAVKFLGLL